MKLKSAIIIVTAITLVLICYYIMFYEEEYENVKNTVSKETLTDEIVLFPNIPPRKDVLVYNPVPKTGSTSFATTLKRLSKKNGFSYQKLGDRGNSSRQYDIKSMSAFVDKVLEQPVPSVTNRHIHFVDFNDPRLTNMNEEYNRTRLNPTYINSLRDPLDRFRSRYHYGRQENKRDWYFYDLYKDAEPMTVAGIDNETWVAKNINDCILDRNDRECNYQEGDVLDHSIAFFCGQHRFCVEYGNVDAVLQAKENIEKYYTVVMIVEREEDSVRLLEETLPQYFKGLSKLPKASKNVGKSEKVPLKEEALKRLRHVLRFEQELYEFALQRLDLQLTKLNIARQTE